MFFMQVLFSVLFPCWLGYVLLALVAKKESSLRALERMALAYGAGIGLLTVIMFLMNEFLRLPLSWLNIVLVCLSISVPAGFWCIYKKYSLVDLNGLWQSLEAFISFWKISGERLPKILTGVLAGLLSLRIICVLGETLIKPITSWDALERYSLLAKAILFDHSFQSVFAKGLAQSNPYFGPLSQAWILLNLGTFNDVWSKLTPPLLLLSLLVVFYYVLRRDLSTIYSLFFTYLLASLPFILYHATTVYSDFPQTYYYAVSTFYLYVWFGQKKNYSLILSALFLGLCIMVKKGGISYFFVNSSVLALYLAVNGYAAGWKEKLKKLGLFIVLVLLISSPWTIMQNYLRMLDLPTEVVIRTMPAPAAPLSGAASQDLEQVPGTLGTPVFEIVSEVINRCFMHGNWNIAWFAFVMVLLLCVKPIFSSNMKYLFYIIVINLLALFYALYYKIHLSYILQGTILNRLVMCMLPLVILFIAEVTAFLPSRKK